MFNRKTKFTQHNQENYYIHVCNSLDYADCVKFVLYYIDNHNNNRITVKQTQTKLHRNR